MATARTTPKKPVEGKKPPLEFEFEGQKYSITAEDVDDLELFELIEDGKAITAIRQILGTERWEQFKTDHRGENGRVTMSTLNSFLGELMVAIGKSSRSGN